MFKRFFERLRKGFRRDNRGLSLVELICTIAIFSIVVGGTGTVLVISAKSYQRGTQEAELQQIAQMAVNQIQDMVLDSSASMGGTASELNIVKADAMYCVRLDSTNRYLTYEEYKINIDGVSSVTGSAQLLAEYVDVFTADLSTFNTNGNILLHLELSNNDRSYAADFTVTSRNIGSNGESAFNATITVSDNALVLEPNEEQEITITVEGNLMNKAVEAILVQDQITDKDNTVLEDLGEGRYKVKVGLNERTRSFPILFQTVEKNGLVSYASAIVEIHVRRVNNLDLNGTRTSGGDSAVGAKYHVVPTLDVSYAAKETILKKDIWSYVDPRAVKWEYTIDDLMGGIIESGTLTAAVSSTYISPSFGTDANGVEYCDITLKKNMKDIQLTVKCTALHPSGTNRTGITYGTIYDTWSLHPIIMKAGEWVRAGNSPMFMEEINPDYFTEASFDPTKRMFKNFGAVEMTWYKWSRGEWVELTRQNNTGGWQTFESTNSGIVPNIDTANNQNLSAYLVAQSWRNSYSSIYYMGNFVYDYGLSKLKLVMDVAGYETRVGIFEIEEVVFQYTNSHDAPYTSASGGTQVVYATMADTVQDYKTYVKLTGGWNDENQNYLIFNRYVGVITDVPGTTVGDEAHDLMFVLESGNTTRDTGSIIGKDAYGNPKPYNLIYESRGKSYDHLTNFIESSSGGAISYVLRHGNNIYTPELQLQHSNGSESSVVVRVTQEEKETYGVRNYGNGTVIKEIYEYNPFLATDVFNPEDINSATNMALQDQMDGCPGVLEYHIVMPNVAASEPAVKYCPLAGGAGLDASGCYYMSENARYQVSGSTAYYQEKSGGVWNTIRTLTYGPVTYDADDCYYLTTTCRYQIVTVTNEAGEDETTIQLQQYVGGTWNVTYEIGYSATAVQMWQ